MQKTILMAALVLVAACSGASGNDGGVGGGSATGGGSAGGAGGGTSGSEIAVSADIAGDTTWTANNTYRLKTLIYVNAGTLTIEPGTVIKGDLGSALVVAPTAKINASGTKEKPIVFTSSKAVGSRGKAEGDWGGVVLLGHAKINTTGGINNAEGLADEPRNKYGGTDDTHNCGTVKYTRIEFAGAALSANNELNGLTLYACGSQTVIDYVQIHRGLDDAIEIFGGTVDIKHLVLTGMDDDGLDWDQGWTGRGQFIVVQQNTGYGNHGIEADSNRDGNDLLPRANPTLWNVTLIGRNPDTTPSEGDSRGLMLRQGTAGKLTNFIVTNFTKEAMLVDHPATATQWASGALFVKNSIFFHNPTAGWSAAKGSTIPDAGVDNQFDEATALALPALSNRDTDPMLTDALNITAPNFKPMAGSPALTGGATPSGDTFFDATASFVGAVGADDWTAGWTSYPKD